MNPRLRICFAMLFISFSVLYADVFTVTNTNGSGSGSLAAAISSANSLPGTHTVEFDLPRIRGMMRPMTGGRFSLAICLMWQQV